jgi:serine/threonine-protein kinase HipA
MVDDEGRQGALRFKREEQGPFLTTYDKNHIPPLVSVGKLLTAASHVMQDSDTEEDPAAPAGKEAWMSAPRAFLLR